MSLSVELGIHEDLEPDYKSKFIFMKQFFFFSALAVCLALTGHSERQEHFLSSVAQVPVSADTVVSVVEVPRKEKLLTADDVTLTKDLLYDTYTSGDTYPYKDTVRSLKWNMIRSCLAYIENAQRDSVQWVVLQNYKSMNQGAPLMCNFIRNAYRRVADVLGVERYQSALLYLPGGTLVPERHGRDGALACLRGMEGSFGRIFPITLEDEWLIPRRYLKWLDDSTAFSHVVFVDRLDQNIITLGCADKGHQKICSMSPTTTGRHTPPYAQETPLGMYLLQQKKSYMVFLKDGSTTTGRYVSYASRFTNGAYIHGVPVNVPHTEMIECS